MGATLLGKFRVLRELGVGGMGEVYEVEHLLTRHRRALKVLRAEYVEDATAVARLLREATVAGRVGSPRLVETFDVGRLEDGAPFVLMELLEGRTLDARLTADGRMQTPEALRLGLEVAEGLSAAHAAGVIHRDLTPRNVFLVVGDDRLEHAKLLDFGLAKMVSGEMDQFGRLTQTGAFLGTPHYMSPEQARGHAVDARADQHALGVILYECLSGQRPYRGSSIAEVLARIAEGRLPPLETLRPDLDPRLTAAIAKAMSPRPDQRFAKVAVFASQLQGLLAERSSPSLGQAPTVDVVSLVPSAPPARRVAATAAMSASAQSPDVTPVAPTESWSTSSSRPPSPRAPSPRAVTGPASWQPRSQSAHAPAPPPRRRSRTAWLVAGFAVVGVLVLVGAFAVTVLLLRGRATQSSAHSPGSATPAPGWTPYQNEQELQDNAALDAYLNSHDYRGCLDAAHRMTVSDAVLRHRMACAAYLRDWNEYESACRELNHRNPVDPAAMSCRDAAPF